MRVIFISCILLIASSSTVFSQASEPCYPDSIADVYEYPIKPGTPEWKNYSHTEHLEMLQLADTVLSRITTEGLLLTCLNYPFLGNMIAFDSYQLGVERVIVNFNALQELLERPEVVLLLMKEYINLDPVKVDPDWTILQIAIYKYRFMFIEMLLGQEELLSQLSKTERRQLLEECLSKYTAKVQDETYGTIHWKTTAVLMGRILLVEGDGDFRQKYDDDEKLRIFLRDAGTYTIEQLNTIVESADKNIDRYQEIQE